MGIVLMKMWLLFRSSIDNSEVWMVWLLVMGVVSLLSSFDWFVDGFLVDGLFGVVVLDVVWFLVCVGIVRIVF